MHTNPPKQARVTPRAEKRGPARRHFLPANFELAHICRADFLPALRLCVLDAVNAYPYGCELFSGVIRSGVAKQ